jgi:polyhydroxybutyrate depolymerase
MRLSISLSISLSMSASTFASTLLLFLCCAFRAAAADGIPTEIRLSIDGVERRALLVDPVVGDAPRPLVLVLHGGMSNAEAMRAQSGFDRVAVDGGFATVYAEGTTWAPGRHAWNTGHLLREQVSEADDIAYFDALIDLLIARHRIDPDRVYMTGGSNGAMMTFVYALRRPQRLAAIAPVVGAMFGFDETPAEPVPILMINGGRDAEVPVDGGMSLHPLVRRNQRTPYRSLEETVAFWVTANRSLPTPTVEVAGTVTTRTHAPAPGGAVTISVLDADGGHGWPGTRSRRADNTPIRAFDGAQRVWAFFRTQRRP